MNPQTPTITSTTSEIINLEEKKKGRRKTEWKLSREKILQILFEPLFECFSTFTNPYPRMREVLRTTILACVQRTSIDDVCSYLDDSINARTARYYLSWLKLDRIEKGMNDLLRRDVLPLIKNKWVRLMIDQTNIPYYGTGKNDSEVRKSKAKVGTSRFHAYMTVYAVVKNHRYTIAIRYVRKDEELSAVVKDTLDGILAMNLNIRQILADKEFYSTRLINYLKGIDIPFIIAVPERGCHIKALKTRNKGGRCMPWRIRNARKEKATFCLQAYQKYMKGSKVLGGGATWFFYATYKMQKNPKRISDEYRMRFGIESSYRMMNTCRARTSSKDPALRLFFVLISFLIVNLKVLFEWLSRTDGRINRRTSASLMRLKKLCRQIQKVFEASNGWRSVHRTRNVMAGG